MVTTHTGSQRGEATSVSVEQDEWDSHTSEKTEKFIAVHPRPEEFVGFLPLTQQSLTVFCKTLKGQC